MYIRGSGTPLVSALLSLRLPSLLFILLGCRSVPDITLLKILVSLNVILNPVLVPLSLFQGKDGQGEVCSLDRLSWANVGLAHSNVCWAHLSVALTVFICMCCVAGIFAVLVSMIWGFPIVQGERKNDRRIGWKPIFEFTQSIYDIFGLQAWAWTSMKAERGHWLGH